MTILKTCLQPHFRRSMIQQDNMEAVQSVDTRFHVPHGIQREHNENNTAQGEASSENMSCMVGQGQKHKIKKVQEENVNESNEYERLRNKRVLENKTKMLELFPQIKVASSNLKRKRIATLKVVEAICDSTMEASKPKAKKSIVDGDKLLDAALAKDMGMQYQGIQMNTLLESSKKAIAMVVMGLGKTHKVLPQTSEFASKNFPELIINTKKEETDRRRRSQHLNLVVAWALKEFKVGIINAPPMSDGPQLLFLDNIKKL